LQADIASTVPTKNCNQDLLNVTTVNDSNKTARAEVTTFFQRSIKAF